MVLVGGVGVDVDWVGGGGQGTMGDRLGTCWEPTCGAAGAVGHLCTDHEMGQGGAQAVGWV